MQAKVMDLADVSYLDELLFDSNGLIRVWPAAELKTIPGNHIIQWCVQRGVYQLPTTELIAWLAKKIAGKRAIEIGAGRSGIGNALGITATDSYMQSVPEIAAYYKALGQATTDPPSYVEKLDAHEAIRKYNPEVVIGAYITQRWLPGDVDGNQYGPHEIEIIKRADYIFIGNEATHGKKRVLSKPHQTYKFPWLVSRGFDPTLNVIWHWELGS